MNNIQNSNKAELFFSRIIPIYSSYSLSRAIYVVTKLEIVEILEKGSMHADDIAQKLTCHAGNLLRVLNLVESYGIFKKNAHGHFENTTQSLQLRRNLLGNAIIEDQDRNWKKLGSPTKEFLEALDSKVEDSTNPIWKLARGYLLYRAIYGAIVLGFETIWKQEGSFSPYLAEGGLVKDCALTPEGELLLDEGCQEFFKHDIEERWLAMGHLENAVRTGSIPFVDLYKETFFNYLGLHPEKTKNFDKSMSFVTECEIAKLKPVIQEELKFGVKVIDIGGGHGKFLTGLIEDRKDIQGMLFDLPSSVQDHKIPSELLERCAIVGGDFFKEIPEADAYVIKRVLHDWDDEDCIRILKNCKKNNGAKLIINEFISPNPLALAIDVNMLSLFSGKERTLEDFAKICAAAGWTIQTVKPTDFCLSTIIAE